MTHVTMHSHQSSARRNVVHAVIFAAPLWAAGLIFLMAFFSAENIADPNGLKFLALALLVVCLTAMFARKAMANELQRAQELQEAMCQLMKLRAKRQHGSHSAHDHPAFKTSAKVEL